MYDNKQIRHNTFRLIYIANILILQNCINAARNKLYSDRKKKKKKKSYILKPLSWHELDSQNMRRRI